ncbi:nuclear transport factor 2 family protein [Flagellimonas baculiformis]|uniref:nuclear transport factor 2 family protein n=1 Tax=Flagellimonas baculiformis TaxID=3067310 RepID=UPI00296FF354|nr:nuclear transport factor 2 family protein [Muricauda sp. D6]
MRKLIDTMGLKGNRLGLCPEGKGIPVSMSYVNEIKQQDMKADFTQKWLKAWNGHNLDEIMEHYSEDIDFVSPIIQKMGIDPGGRISDKGKLRAYFSEALQKYPDLHFEFYHELTGVGSVVLYYRSVNGSLSAEYMELDGNGKVCKVRAHYTQV